MSDSLVVSPPDFLADLMGDVVGKNLACYRSSLHQCTLRIDFGIPEESTPAGLYLAPKTRYGIHHYGAHWEFYRYDRSFMGHAWDDNQPDQPGPLCTFEEWARREVVGLIWNRLYSVTNRLLEGLNPDLDKAGKRKLIERCKNILECAEKHGLESRSFAPVVECVQLAMEASFRKLAFFEVQGLKRRLRKMEGNICDTNTFFPKVIRYGGLVSVLPENLKETLSSVLLKRVRSETRAFLKEYKSNPCNHTFANFKDNMERCETLFNSEVCRLMDEESKRRRAAEQITPEIRSIMKLTEEYIELRRDFWNYWPTPEGAEERGKRMVEQESFINNFWRDWAARTEEITVEESGPPMPTPGSMKAAALNQAIQQGRFLSVGSQVYVGWLRNIERWDDAVAYVIAQTSDLELCSLRHQSHPGGFESFLCNGLGCFVDSKQDEHPPLGVQVIDRLETIISFESGCLLYQFTCVLARAGETERALDYAEKAIDAGQRFNSMAKDSDLKSLLKEPRFMALEKVDLLSAA